MEEQLKTFQEPIKEGGEKSLQKEDFFWLEQKEQINGNKMLSCRLNGKHYVGWWFTKEQKREDGTTYDTEIAKMRLCNWEGCSICHPNQIIV